MPTTDNQGRVLSIRFPGSLYQQISALAERDCLSHSAVVRLILATALRQQAEASRPRV